MFGGSACGGKVLRHRFTGCLGVEMHTAAGYGRDVPQALNLITHFGAHLETVVEDIANGIVDATYEQVPGYRGVPRDDLLQATMDTLGVFAKRWREGRVALPRDLPFDVEVVRRRARQGATAADWIAHAHVFSDATYHEIRRFARANGHPDAEAVDLVVSLNASMPDHSEFARIEFAKAAAEIDLEAGQLVRDAVLGLLRGGHTPGRARAAALAAGIDPDRLHRAARVRPGDETLARRLSRAEPTVGPRAIWVHADGEVVGVLPDGGPADADACGGIGPAVALEGLPASFAAAAAAQQAVARFGLHGLHRIEDLGILPLVLTEGVAADAVVERYVAAVERMGDSGRALVDTVAAYLRSGMHPGRTAEGLHLHPNSLRKRLARYGELTGADLRSMDDLAAIWWALRRREMGDG